jgi:outer membrane protein TolC
LDVSQQREALAEAKAQMPLLEIQVLQLRSSLAILLGKAGTDLPLAESARLPDLIALPDAGVPADLLAARPDVRAAGLRLKAADWSVAAARADRLPAITLSAAAAFSSGSLDLLFDNWLLKLAGSITGPLFDAGYRSAEVNRTRAVAEEYLSAYAQTVATAVREVEDVLVTEQHQATYIALLQDQLDAARMTLQDARLQYINGQSDYLSYLTAWSSVQSLQRQLVGEQAARIKYRVTLYRALGGSWIEDLASRRSADKMADTPLEGSL